MTINGYKIAPQSILFLNMPASAVFILILAVTFIMLSVCKDLPGFIIW